jgi:hypothetical protein
LKDECGANCYCYILEPRFKFQYTCERYSYD